MEDHRQAQWCLRCRSWRAVVLSAVIRISPEAILSQFECQNCMATFHKVRWLTSARQSASKFQIKEH